MHITPHFQSSLLQIEDACCGGHDHQHTEEYSYRYEVVFTRYGMFHRADHHGKVLADVNQMLFFRANQPYQVAHPVSGGDRCTIFALDAHLLQEMSGIEPDELPGAAVIDPAYRLLLYRLLHAIAASDPLTVEEETIRLLGSLLRQVLDRQPPRRDQREIVEQVKVLLSHQFDQNLRLETIAQAVYASPFWLCRQFKNTTGISIHQYLQRVRLFHALDRLLEYPHEPLTEIALRVGFYSHSHFTTAFTREFGLSPSAIRKERTKQIPGGLRSRISENSRIPKLPAET